MELSDGGDRAVSSVVGVVLLVAVTVLLAAITGVFVFDIGSGLSESPPQIALTVEDASEDLVFEGPSQNGDLSQQRVLTISHDGGQRIDTDRLRIVLRNDSRKIAVWEPARTSIRTSRSPTAVTPASTTCRTGSGRVT